MTCFRRVLCMLFVTLICFSCVSVVQASDDGLKNEMGKQKIKGKWDFAWPAPGVKKLTSCFYDDRNHYAIDIGTDGKVVAMYDGTVVWAKDHKNGFGLSVMLKHNYVTADGRNVVLYSHYGHLSIINTEVKENKPVKKGDPIGIAGKTGGNYEIHLDFTILKIDDLDEDEISAAVVSEGGRIKYAIDPFHNMLVPPPSGLTGSDYTSQGGCDCGPYVKDVLAFYEAHKDDYSIGGFSHVADIEVVVTIRSDKGIKEYKLQDEPYAAANTVKTVAPGTNLTTTGVYKNKYGNYWLRFKDGTYLCANDVKLKTQVSAPTASSLVYPKGNLALGASFNLEGKITSKSTMAEVWAVVQKHKGDEIDYESQVTVCVKNVTSLNIKSSAINSKIKFGDLTKGDYYYSLHAYYYVYKNVEKTSDMPLYTNHVLFLEYKPFTVGGGSGTATSKPTSKPTATPTPKPTATPAPSGGYEYTELFDISAQFRNTEKRNSKVAPYASSDTVKSCAKDAIVTATKFVVNSYGNIWAQLEDGSYLCFYDFDSGENKMKYVGTTAAVNVSDVKKPTGDLSVGSAYNLLGVLKASVPFYRVSAQVIDRKTNEPALDVINVYPKMTVRTVDLNKNVRDTKTNKDVNINYKVYINNLKKGWYTYAVKAWMGFTYNGKTFNFGNDTIVIKSDFTVGNPGALPSQKVLVESIKVLNPVSKLTFGEPYDFRWEVYPNNATDKTVTWTSSNEDVIWLPAASGVPGVDEDVYADVFYTGCGLTTITVSANDGSGVSYSFDVLVEEPPAIGGNELTVSAISFDAMDIGAGKDANEVIAYINISNPYEVALSDITLDFDLPDGVTVSNVKTVGSAAGAAVSLGDPTYITELFNSNSNGVVQGKCLEITFKLDSATLQSCEVMITPTVATMVSGSAYKLRGFATDLGVVIATPRTPGDADVNGAVNFNDALLLLQYAAGEDVRINTSNADVNADGKADIHDVLLLLQYYSGWNVTLK